MNQLINSQRLLSGQIASKQTAYSSLLAGVQSRAASLDVQRFQGRGQLDRSDRVDPNFRKRYYYDNWYLPRAAKVGDRVEVSLSSNQFNPYLYLTNSRQRRSILLAGLDTRLTDGTERLSRNARLTFTVKSGLNYFLRASTTSSRETGGYSIRYRIYKSPASDFNFFYGSGLVNASAAVNAAGQSTAPVAALGDDDWGRNLIQAPAVWARGNTGKGVTVAVIDTGVDYNHSELKSNIWTNTGEIPGNGIDDDRNGYIDDLRGWDFVDNDNDPSDALNDGHGTHVAGIVAAARDGTGITGVAPDAKIMLIRVLGQSRDADPTGNLALIQGIDYAVNNGAKVINLSLSKGYRYDFEFGAALQRANQAGAVVVIAAGNERETEGAFQPSELGYRAMVNNLGIAVGAVDREGKLGLFSNPAGQGKGNFVVAPGVDVRSTLPGNQFGVLSGTSMATPHVSGVAALLLSANPRLTPAQVYSILGQTAQPQSVTVTP